MTVSFSSILKRNSLSTKELQAVSTAINPTVAVFVGATSGIGEHSAYAFAKYTPFPRLYIVGRNEESGQRVISQLSKINPNAKAEFVKKDMTLIEDADSLSEMIMQNEKKVNLLFLSPGFLSLNGRTETKEGLDTKMAINYYGRWRVVQNLLPLVQAASELNENARVVSVLAPGTEGPVNMNDLELKDPKNYSLYNVNRHFTEFNSLAVVRFGQLYPNIGFLHAGPGGVNTGITREFPWYLRIALKPVMLFASRPEDSAERFYYISQGSDDFRTGSHIIDGSFHSLKEKFTKRGYLTPELQETVWKHSEDTFAAALKKDITIQN